MLPRLLRADNLTPPTRTPWGGTWIARHYKARLGLKSTGVVGESWEVSVEPSFPSRFADDDTLLSEAIAADPVGWLGPEVAEQYGGQTPLLVKLLDADDNLSVQVHPADGDPRLAAGESGKPEGWIVLDAREGAGLYLGFRVGVSRADVEACLASQGRLDALMNFVPVCPGDVFVIDAGTVHGIGSGVTLVEPQFVAPGRRGVTYRFWDWNRRYDAEGRRDPNGEPRELHVARSLEVTDWTRGTGADFVASCRVTPKHLSANGIIRTHVIDWPWFQSERWQGSGTTDIPAIGTMLTLTAVGGEGRVETRDGAETIERGQSMVVPASVGAFTVSGRRLDVVATYSPVTAPA